MSTTRGIADRPVLLVAPGITRITCANSGPMTHTGTQTYVLAEAGEAAVIDPGPDDPEQTRAILEAVGDGNRVMAILVTHSHRDHSPGAAALAEVTGAPVLAFGPHGAGMSPTMRRLAEGPWLGGGEGADASFSPDRTLADGEGIALGGITLTALHTPGHLSNHLCFAIEDAGLLFTGDTVMGWSSTLVSPPDGDMAAFMASLARLEARAAAGTDRRYLPAHGEPVDDPLTTVRQLATHRRARALQITAALAAGPATVRSLTRGIYTDVDPGLLPAAERNVLATLIWLAEDRRVATNGPPGPDTVFRLA